MLSVTGVDNTYVALSVNKFWLDLQATERERYIYKNITNTASCL